MIDSQAPALDPTVHFERAADAARPTEDRPRVDF